MMALSFVQSTPSQALTNRSLLQTISRSPKPSSGLIFGKGFELLNLGVIKDQQQANVLELDNGELLTEPETRIASTACLNQSIMLAG
jgi:hypothetical protein